MKTIFCLAGVVAFAAAQQNSVKIGTGFIKFPVARQNFTKPTLRSGKRQDSVDLTNQELGTSYTIQLQLGTPPQNVVVQLDTGSTDLWVNPNCGNVNGATQIAFCNSFPRYSPAASSSFADTGAGTTIQYGKGDATIEYVRDFVRAGSATLKAQTFGVASNSHLIPFGILGIGPHIEGSPVYTFFIDNLKAQGLTNSRAFSLDLRNYESSIGSVVFGGVDTGKYIGSLEKLPIIQAAEAPDRAARYWVSLASVSMGGNILTSGAIPVLLDSGTTLSFLPPALHTAIGTRFPTARLDPGGSNFYIVDCSVADQPGSVDFTFGRKTIKVAYSNFIWHASSTICVVGTQPTSDVYILGDSFLRAVYAVFDQDNQNIHVAQAADCGTNLVAIGTGVNAVPSIAGDCGISSTSTSVLASSTSSAAQSSSFSASTTSTISFSLTSTTIGSISSTTSSSKSSRTFLSSASSSSSSSSASASKVTSVSTTSASITSSSTTSSKLFPNSTSTISSRTQSHSSSKLLSTTVASTISSGTQSHSSSKLLSTTVTSTIKITTTYTVTACPATVTNCPVGKVTTEIITTYTTYCPVDSTTDVTASATGTPAFTTSKSATVSPGSSRSITKTTAIVSTNTLQISAKATETSSSVQKLSSSLISNITTIRSSSNSLFSTSERGTVATSVSINPTSSHSTIATAGARKIGRDAGVGLMAAIVFLLL